MNFPNQSQISPTTSNCRLATKATVEAGVMKNWEDLFANFYMAVRPGRRGRADRQAEEVKLPVMKREKNLMKYRERDLGQALKMENNETTRSAVVSGRDTRDVREEQQEKRRLTTLVRTWAHV